MVERKGWPPALESSQSLQAFVRNLDAGSKWWAGGAIVSHGGGHRKEHPSLGRIRKTLHFAKRKVSTTGWSFKSFNNWSTFGIKTIQWNLSLNQRGQNAWKSGYIGVRKAWTQIRSLRKSPNNVITIGPLYPWGICSKTPSRCLKLQIVSKPIYTVFSYTQAHTYNKVKFVN